VTGDNMITLFEHPLSPYAQKVKLALLEKGVDFSLQGPSFNEGAERDAFLKLSPRGEVPMLVVGDETIFDSSIILEYIEDRWPTPPLLPASPGERARVRMLEDVMDTHFEANTWGLSEVKHFGRAEGELADRLNSYAGHEIRGWFTWLDAQLGERPWFNGANFGWGDLCVAPFVNGATRFDLYPDPASRLAAWLQRVNARPTVAQCKEAADAAELDAQIMQAAIAAGFKREYRDHRLEWMVKAGGMAVVTAGLAADNVRFTTVFGAD